MLAVWDGKRYTCCPCGMAGDILVGYVPLNHDFSWQANVS